MDIRNKILFTSSLLILGLGILLIFQQRNIGKMRLIFCDVGQGDGMLLISPGGHEVLVDAGAGMKISDCLSHNMPFWDRQIELIVPTHPHQEHMEGFLDVLGRYEVRNVLTTNIPNDTQFYKVWQKAVADEGSKIIEPDLGEVVLLDPERGPTSSKLEILWPGRDQIAQWKQDAPSDLNEVSIVMRLTYGGFCAYLTGDLPKELLEPLIDKQCQVLKVVHHGSRTGTSDKLVEEIKPQIAVIQVGAKNKFGHPHKEVLDILNAHGVKVLRNDLSGTIEVDSDGKSFTIDN